MAPNDHRLFFALYPDTTTTLRIAALVSRLRTQLGLEGRPHELQRFHVTLHHLGDFVGMPEALRETAEAAAGRVSFPPISLSFDHLLSFSRKAGNRPLVLGGGAGVEGVKRFRNRLGEALEKAGLPLKNGSFTLVPQQAVEPIGWTAGEFVLVNSLLGQRRHVALARWPLDAKDIHPCEQL
jgi:2'-5' RNA ligase